jgi:hypothetical protein
MRARTFAPRYPGCAIAILPCGLAAALLLLSQPAAAFYAPVKPVLKVGNDCIGKTSQLAPNLTACPIADTKIRIWCPNGEMFEGKVETVGRGIDVSLARSLCKMTQVP